ncbi:hypothetical protein LPJ76_004941 [Coemansia sp. RSA 638]|nr:hypothetical protein LPJ76_004941 [Coemansia sp. RSA 638]
MAAESPSSIADKSACVAAQVRQSRLSLCSTGYRLQSVDSPTRTLVLGFDGQVFTETGSEVEDQQTVIVHVIAGIFKLEQHRYVLAVTDSHCQGTISGKDIYEVSGVCALPLDYDSGKTAFQELLQEQITRASGDKSTAAPRKSYSTGDVAGLAAAQLADSSSADTNDYSTGEAGFRWLSPQISRMFRPSRESLTSGTEDGATRPSTPHTEHGGSDVVETSSGVRKTSTSLERMERRVVEEIARVFSTSGMFYAFDYDLTRSLQVKDRQVVDGVSEPLACTADRDYWFNWHIQQPLLTGGGLAWALPLVQGSVQIGRCQISKDDVVQISVVSRRNWRRIGMRYERRGADTNGNVANFVETEQILELESKQESGQHADVGAHPTHIASFVQTRGSMPFFWTQTGAGLHPAAVVAGTDDSNATTCAQHLQHEISRVGRQVLVSLVEHGGREAAVGTAYAGVVGRCVASEMIDARMVRYVPWDFHHETRGMRYENVQQLVEQLRGEISSMGYYWRAGNAPLTTQHGIFRVNFMDCLDRTNVVQSAIARAVFNEQLVRLGVHAAPELGLAAHAGLEPTLNRLWANNGDYISRQYAGTSAMKGDFTRTGRRNFGGMVNDATYSLARLWINTFRDYFSQAVLDFLVGNHTASAVFRTLIDLRSREPDQVRQMASARETAVRTSVAIVVRDGERVQLACVVQSPMALDSLKIAAAADSVLILTDAAVYVCSYCDRQQKVSEFLRIGLSVLTRVQYGAYITDTRTPQCLDPSRNHGVVLSFALAADHHSSSPGNGFESSFAAAQPSVSSADGEKLHFISCKVASEAQVVMQHTPDDAKSAAHPTLQDAGQPALVRLTRLENQAPDLLTECLCSAMLSLKLAHGDTSSQFITDAPIISVAAAKQSKTLVEKMTTRLHNALWI